MMNVRISLFEDGAMRVHTPLFVPAVSMLRLGNIPWKQRNRSAITMVGDGSRIWRKQLGPAILLCSIFYGLHSSPDWLRYIERAIQLQNIDRNSGGADIQEAARIIRSKFALLPINDIDARLNELNIEVDSKLVSIKNNNLRLSDVLRSMKDPYTRVVPVQELEGFRKFDPSDTGIVLREGMGGIFISSAGRHDVDKLMEGSEVLNVAGRKVLNIYDAAELLIQSKKPLHITLKHPPSRVEKIAVTEDVVVDRERDESKLVAQSVSSSLIKQNSFTIGYIRIKEFTASVGDEVAPCISFCNTYTHARELSGTRGPLLRMMPPCTYPPFSSSSRPLPPPSLCSSLLLSLLSAVSPAQPVPQFAKPEPQFGALQACARRCLFQKEGCIVFREARVRHTGEARSRPRSRCKGRYASGDAASPGAGHRQTSTKAGSRELTRQLAPA